MNVAALHEQVARARKATAIALVCQSMMREDDTITLVDLEVAPARVRERIADAAGQRPASADTWIVACGILRTLLDNPGGTS